MQFKSLQWIYTHFEKRNEDAGRGGALHLPLHEPSYECVTECKEWGKDYFIADAAGMIAAIAHVRFLTVNCFCKEMGVFGRAEGERRVYK